MNLHSPDLLAWARQATHHQHELLEASLGLSDATLTRETYRLLLAGFLGLFEPIENALTQLSLPTSLEREKRKRTPALVMDLLALGLNPSEIRSLPRCADIPSLATQATALGTMYVLEGSTLGGQYLARIVEQRLGVTSEAGCAFFYSYGGEVATMWKRFGAVVRESVVAADNQRQFVEAAQSTFALFQAWMEKSFVVLA